MTTKARPLVTKVRCMWCPAGHGGKNTVLCKHCGNTGLTDHVPSWNKAKGKK
jgi:hypothetical protein